ncbi:MAG: alkene reductase, partial [Myxococcota bacterium]
AVHEAGSYMFVQLMHVGRVGHPHNLPEGAELVAPSAIGVSGEMYTDQEGPQPLPEPREMSEADIEHAIEEHVTAARNAIAAGMDGVELHGANGYLIEQFLHPNANQRTDGWGGSAEARNRFLLEIARRCAEAIGADRVGVRLSPYGVLQDLGAFEGLDAQYKALAEGLGALKLAYIHLVDHESMGTPPVPESIQTTIREAFGGVLILSGGYDATRAEADLAAEKGDLIAFGRPFLANPDLLKRLEQGLELNAPRFDLFYTPGPEGYTDYPTV